MQPVKVDSVPASPDTRASSAMPPMKSWPSRLSCLRLPRDEPETGLPPLIDNVPLGKKKNMINNVRFDSYLFSPSFLFLEAVITFHLPTVTLSVL